MLKAIIEKIELRFNRKNLIPIAKINVLLEAFYQEYETDFFNVIGPFRYQKTQTHLSFSHQFPRYVKDAAWKFINAMLKNFKSSLDPYKGFLKPPMPG